jgi:hypothetical protein
MKKRNFETKIITGLLTAGMILSLTACGSSSNGSYGISDLMDADYAVASKEAAAPEASAYEDGFDMTEDMPLHRTRSRQRSAGIPRPCSRKASARPSPGTSSMKTG